MTKVDLSQAFLYIILTVMKNLNLSTFFMFMLCVSVLTRTLLVKIKDKEGKNLMIVLSDITIS